MTRISALICSAFLSELPYKNVVFILRAHSGGREERQVGILPQLMGLFQ